VNGYFSRIAKQSGFRFAAPAVGSPRASEKPAAAVPSPIELEETILVPPRVAEPSGISSELKAPSEPKKVVRPLPQSRAAENPSLTNAGKELANKSDAPGELVSRPRPQQNQPDSLAGKAVGESRGLEPSVPQDSHFTEPGQRSDPIQATEPKTRTIETEQSETGAKQRFFTRTAEVIERGGADSAEIQNILLLEVQEWAAAAPVNELERGENLETKAATKLAQPWSGREPSAIKKRAIHERPSARHAEETEQARIEEQTFNLAIGTISVVIEDAAPPLPQPEARPRGPERQNARQESSRPLSRLNRNYL